MTILAVVCDYPPPAIESRSGEAGGCVGLDAAKLDRAKTDLWLNLDMF
jgi:hypothetical protein